MVYDEEEATVEVKTDFLPWAESKAISDACTAIREAAEALGVPTADALALVAARFGAKLEAPIDWEEMLEA